MDLIDFTTEEKKIYDLLISLGQDHLFSDWDEKGVNDDLKHGMMRQLMELHETYPVDGGVEAYITRAQKLLSGKNRVSIPSSGCEW